MATRAPADLAAGLERVIDELRDVSPSRDGEPHPSLPSAGATTSRTWMVGTDDTAAALGHPDPAVQVLATPRLGLWFEIVGSDLMPEPSDDTQHVGVGLVVHHVGSAAVGEEVTVTVTVTEVEGRAIVFSCEAVRGGEDLVATGTHHRVVVATDR